MITEASAALGSIKAAIDVAKGVSSLKSSTEVNQAIIDIQRALLEAQAAAFEDRERVSQLLKKIDELEHRLAKGDGWEAEKERYKLVEKPTGALVYALKEESRGDDPDHCLCVKCFDEGRKSVLQVKTKHSGGERVECQHCGKTLLLSNFPPVKPISPVRSWPGY